MNFDTVAICQHCQLSGDYEYSYTFVRRSRPEVGGRHLDVVASLSDIAASRKRSYRMPEGSSTLSTTISKS